MRMGFRSDYQGAFFIEPFVIDGKARNFFIAVLFVFLYMFLYTLISY